jgi:hypothetical protein
MELSSQESIRALMGACGISAPSERRRGAQSAPGSAHHGRKMRCKCGRCSQCLDNARWERIFTEKFEDPDYYTHQVIHYASPLTSL